MGECQMTMSETIPTAPPAPTETEEAAAGGNDDDVDKDGRR